MLDRTMAEEQPKANSERCLLCQATGKLLLSHIYPDFFIRSLETKIETGIKGQKQPGAAKGEFFRDVYLGRHQERLGELLVHDDPGNDNDYAIMLMDLRHEGAGIEDFIEQPGWTRDDEGRRFYKLIIGGFMFIIYVIGGDQRPPEFVNNFRLRSSGKLVIGVANAKPILLSWAKRLRAADAFPRK